MALIGGKDVYDNMSYQAGNGDIVCEEVRCSKILMEQDRADHPAWSVG
jgi:hypothetical protein